MKAKNSKGKVPTGGLAAVADKDLLRFVESAMSHYGKEVNLERAVPDFRDGLKPVARRLLWAMHQLPGDGYHKSARLVGDCMGKYHPHGDCLSGSTLVHLLSGEIVEIQDLVGEGKKWVLAVDPETGDIVPAMAHSFRIGQHANKIYTVHLSDGSTVDCTGNHPFLTKDLEWVKAEELEEETKLFGGYLEKLSGISSSTLKDLSSAFGLFVVKVTVVEFETAVPMYDFTVEDYENMLIASADSEKRSTLVCVHNSSLYGAAINMVTSGVPTFTGKGNWGTLVDPAAAHRYTNITMSRYGKLFFGKHYTPITDLVPNFDRSDKEPLVLPALLPNLLFNGTEGIGVGVATSIPAFVPSTVLECMVRLLDGEVLEPSDYAKTLRFYYQYGGVVPRDKAGMRAVKEFFGSTRGSIPWSSPLEIDPVAKTITLSKFAPGIDPVKIIEKKIKPLSEVKSAVGGKGLSYVITAKKELNEKDFGVLVSKITKLTSTSAHYDVYVTERLVVDVGDKVEYKVNFMQCSIPKLMVMWLKWRISLEIRSLDWRIKSTKSDIAYIKLLIYAADSLDIIFKGLRQPDPKAYIMKHMKISDTSADQILDLKVRQLSKLDQDKLKLRLKEAQDHLKDLVLKRKKPKLEVKKFLQSNIDIFTPYSTWAGTNQLCLGKL